MAKKSRKNTPKPLIIDDESIYKARVRDSVFYPTIDGERKATGLVPRDYRTDPPEMLAPPSEILLAPRSEWSARIKEQKAQGARLSDIRGQEPSLDQDGRGYCWAHSTTSAVMVLRALMNLPRIRLSAYAIACMIKNFRDEGGWCGLSAKFWREKGCPSAQFWPEKSVSRTNDNPQTWENARQHIITEDFVDLTRDVYDQNLTFDMVASCCLAGIPGAVDYNWWSHSIGWLDLVEVEAGSFGLLIWNSWGDSWEDRGMGILRGSKAIPDGAVALRVTGASPA